MAMFFAKIAAKCGWVLMPVPTAVPPCANAETFSKASSIPHRACSIWLCQPPNSCLRLSALHPLSEYDQF